jgi:hypothetical protein
LLLFRSSKLNEQKANLLKSSGYSTSLQKLNDDPSIQKYFSERLNVRIRFSFFLPNLIIYFLKNTSRYPIQDEQEFFNDTQNPSRPRSMHLGHNEKKYHIQFLKDRDAHDAFYRPPHNRRLLLTERIAPTNIESILGVETSTVHGLSSETNTSNLHRESEKFNQN